MIAKEKAKNVSLNAASFLLPTAPMSAESEKLLEAALRYRERGLCIMPLKKGVGSKIKHPVLVGWSSHCTLNAEIRLRMKETIQRWWSVEYVGANIGICTGPDSGLVVLDLDGPEAEKMIQGLEVPAGPQVQTGKGRHLYFQYPDNGTIIPSINGLRPQIDIKASGGYIVAPPSLHPSGRRYQWIADTENLPLPLIPDWLMGWITGHINKPRPAEKSSLRQAATDENNIISEGERNDKLFRLACSLRRTGLLSDAIEAVLRIVNETRCKPPLPLNDIRVIAGQAAKYEPPKPPESEEQGKSIPFGTTSIGVIDSFVPPAVREDYLEMVGEEISGQSSFDFGLAWNDVGNAQRLINAHGKNIKHCEAWNAWLVWDDRRWARGANYQLVRFAGDVVAQLKIEAEYLPDNDKEIITKKAALAFAKASGSRRKIDDMIALAKAGSNIPVSPDIFDRNKYLLNCANGTLDLKMGILHSHSRADYITKVILAEYHPEAKAPLWEKFLCQIMNGDEELVAFLHRAVGYSLSGDTSEQCLFLLHGGGANGKSTFLTVLQKILGDYARQAAPKTFMRKHNDNGSGFDVASLFGARLVCAVETTEKGRLDESIVKSLTGGDTFSCRRLHENFWSFQPEFKIFLATNHRPNIKDMNNGIWRRILLIPFLVQIPEKEKDTHLTEKLLTESEGILAWAVRGFFEWQENGLQPPTKIIAARDEYRKDQDILGAFIEEACVVKTETHIKQEALFNAYTQWCHDSNEEAMSRKIFTRTLKERGFSVERTTERHSRKTITRYKGINTKNSDELGIDIHPP